MKSNSEAKKRFVLLDNCTIVEDGVILKCCEKHSASDIGDAEIIAGSLEIYEVMHANRVWHVWVRRWRFLDDLLAILWGLDSCNAWAWTVMITDDTFDRTGKVATYEYVEGKEHGEKCLLLYSKDGDLRLVMKHEEGVEEERFADMLIEGR